MTTFILKFRLTGEVLGTFNTLDEAREALEYCEMRDMLDDVFRANGYTIVVDFHVDVVGFNAELFRDNYSEYVMEEEDDYFGNFTFHMCAPLEVYEEIKDLREEMIVINEEEMVLS